MTNTLLRLAESFGVTEAGLMAGVGPAARRRNVNPRLVEAAQLLGSAWQGSPYANLMVHEAFSTSDL
ncbi:MAG: hypothetical protein HOY71_42790, partial [Nonomuraea sp.]|nr:hypothetical protein [Nonomuraea sp.]